MSKIRLAVAVFVIGFSLIGSARAQSGSRTYGYEKPTAPKTYPSPSGNESYSRERVGGYTRNNGTYVAPYSRTTPDNTQLNNWSTKGNVNPDTGKKGTVNPYKY